MNQETFSSKTRQIKALIVIGFFVLVALIVWVSVQIVAYTPSAFTSLASLAQGINQYREAVFNSESLPITSGLSSLESGKPATITWKKDDRPGTYTFSYNCVEGVTVELVSPEGMRQVSCDMRYSLGDTDTLTLVAESAATEPVNISYAVSFMRESDIGPIRIGEQTIAVTPSVTVAQTDTPPAEVPSNTTNESGKSTFIPDEIITPTPPQAPVRKPTPTPKPVRTTQTYTYQIPVSNPNGFTDLTTRFIQTGTIVGNRFTASTIAGKEAGAIQFEVKNTGTKTSDTWTYMVTLPGGDTYIAPTQAALKPNERAVISLGFSIPETDNSHTFVTVVQTEDKTAANNSFRKTIKF